jgi:hypothetical protein
MQTVARFLETGARVMLKTRVVIGLIVLVAMSAAGRQRVFAAAGVSELWVDAQAARGGGKGTQASPYGSLSQAIQRLPAFVEAMVTIHVADGEYGSTGERGMPGGQLELLRRMRPGVEVRIVGERNQDGSLPKLAWEGGTAMVVATEGNWVLENVQIGTGTLRQRRGVMAVGPAQVTLKDVVFRTRSQSDAAIYAERGGLALLSGDIRINEEFHDRAPDESFAGIIATDHGTVRFADSGSGSLDMGNGSLAASYYGCIRLGCKTARITSWGEQSNNLAINNSGRIDLHNTTTTLRAKQRRNTPIGLEHDGHILAEGAHIIIEGESDSAIALQKASTFTCNDIEFKGTFETTLWASSGSMFVGRFLTDISKISATTSARVNIEELAGKTTGEISATRGGTVTLPDGRVVGQAAAADRNEP